ncbi:hypothetical protein ARMSODRAFT_1017308 [Armillaria solidipes]|uniref:Uncharacterized protein n=1 Tax=Armillaria solidipes TaxID=1076256 RepID=A0A2H3BZC2_9AGAR|nr:hypothetical protein ARMSODRAFT_1017308 [Armillaria solidipes]
MHRFTTYIQDEDNYLCKKIREYEAIHPATAFQIDKHQHSHAHFNNQHLYHLIQLTGELGFTDTITLGVHLGTQLSGDNKAASANVSTSPGSIHEDGEEWSDLLQDDDAAADFSEEN